MDFQVGLVELSTEDVKFDGVEGIRYPIFMQIPAAETANFERLGVSEEWRKVLALLLR